MSLATAFSVFGLLTVVPTQEPAVFLHTLVISYCFLLIDYIIHFGLGLCIFYCKGSLGTLALYWYLLLHLSLLCSLASQIPTSVLRIASYIPMMSVEMSIRVVTSYERDELSSFWERNNGRDHCFN